MWIINSYYLIISSGSEFMGELHMMHNVNASRTPVWRKIATLVLLPTIIFLWITGWVLTQTGSPVESTEIQQKTVQANHESQANQENKIPEDVQDSRIANNPEIVA